MPFRHPGVPLWDSPPWVSLRVVRQAAFDEDAASDHAHAERAEVHGLEELTAAQLERRIRAHIGFPKSKLTLLNQSVILTKAHTSSQPKTPLDVVCRDGVYLCIDELIGPSGRRMNAEAFLNGYAA